MPSLGSFAFIFNFFYFFLTVFLAWYIPGRVLLQSQKINFLKRTVLSLILGIVLWGWQGFLFGYLHARFLSFVYIALFIFLFLRRKIFSFHIVNKLKVDWILVILILIGSFLQLIGIFFMGAKVSQGIIMCCGDVADNNLNLSIVNEITHRFPPFEPGMYGQVLFNYHYWSHLVLAELVRVFQLPLVATVYQYAPVFYTLLFGLSLVVMSQLLINSKAFVRWLVFFGYFGGDGAFIISLLHGKLEFPFGALEHGAQLFLNYPRAISMIIFFGGFSLFMLWVKEKKIQTGILMAIVLGSVIGFKVYTGFFVLIGAIFVGIYFLLIKKIRFLPPLFLLGILSFIIFYPVNAHAGGLFYTGFWRANNFIVLGGLGMSQFELAREVYEKAGNYPHMLVYEAGFMLLYVLITWGTKIVGIFQTKKSLSLFPKEVHIFLIPALVASFIIGMFFWQRIGGANTFNFLVSILIIGNMYVALALVFWISKLRPKIQLFLIVLVILFTIPRVVDYTRQIYGQLKSTPYISSRELSALSYLREKTPSNSLYIADPKIGREYQTPYIPYMTNRSSFLSGEVFELGDHGVDFKDRLRISEEIFNSSDSSLVQKYFSTNKINYIYMVSENILPVATEDAKLRKAFDNGIIKIYQVL